jgi:phage repressor protein C with HTH and peptisase S24 domain
MDQNEEIFVRFMNDLSFQKVVTEWMATEAYKRFQAGPARASTLSRTALPPAEDRYVNCVPLVPLKAAAGAFGDPQHIEDQDWEWVYVKSKRRLREGMFVAQVVGKSMEPTIPDGSLCLFAAPVTGTRQGKTVLVQLRDRSDPETGERCTVKRYESCKIQNKHSWQHEQITLKPLNPEYKPIQFKGTGEGELQVIAELIEVIESGQISKTLSNKRNQISSKER